MKIPAQMFLQEYRFLQGFIGNFFFFLTDRFERKLAITVNKFLQLKKLIIIKRYSMFVYEGT